MLKKAIATILAAVMMLTMFVSCSAPASEGNGSKASSGEASSAGSENSAEGENTSKYKEFLTIDVFSSQANYQGIQSGWFGKLVKDKFNMELNIIAPNVAGGGDTLFQTRSAAGNLGDLIITSLQGGRLQDLVTAGLILDLTDYVKDKKNLQEYNDALVHISETLVEEDGIWVVPAEVSKREATEPLTGTDLNFGTYIRWDLYKEMGYPEMKTYEDLLPVMKEMQDMCPESDSGKKTYAFSVFKDWDGSMMGAASQILAFYGNSNFDFVYTPADDSSEPKDILSDDSLYLRGLKFFFDANQMGLVDPESTTQNYDTLYSKYQDGAVLYSPWPWLGQAAYNTEQHLSEGKGFMTADIQDFKLRTWGCYSKGNTENGLMIGSQAQDPERIADFIEWLYSPEGLSASSGQTMITCGPEGLTWEMKDGEPVLTDFGVQCFIGGDADMPEEWGGGTWADGTSQLNYKAISAGEINPETGVLYDYTLWDSYAEMNTNSVLLDWQEHMGAKNPFEYFSNGKMVASAGCGYAPPADSTDIATLREQCKATVVEYSWKAVFAKDEAEFQANIDEMKRIVNGLGYADVVAVEMENTAQQKAAREAVS